ILAGEHAVVYGTPALVAGLDVGATAEVRPDTSRTLTLARAGEVLYTTTPETPDDPMARAWSKILAATGAAPNLGAFVDLAVPPGAGLGSSAAMAAAAARALVAHLDNTSWRPDDPRVAAAVAASEGVFHGTPSGIDQAAALAGGLLRFQRAQDPEARQPNLLRGISIAAPLTCVVVHAEPGASTSEMVASVGGLVARHPSPMRALMGLVAEIVEEAELALHRADATSLGELLDLNHGALVSMGVSTPTLDRACHIARAAGALGAKLTGAGGGGCAFALAPDAHEDVLAAWRHEKWEAFTVTLGSPEHAHGVSHDSA
ncbi:MAG: mevalonate kinase, partial [Myxococcota bacterium]